VGAEKCIYVAPPSNDADVAIEKQIAIVDGLVAQNVDGIVVEPADPKALVPALRKANDEKIRIVTIINDLDEKDWPLRVANVGFSNFQVGVRLAALLRQIKPNGGTVCAVVDYGGAEWAQQRLRGFRATLAGSPSEDVLDKRLEGKNGWVEPAGCPIDAKANFELAYNLVGDVLRKPPGIDALATMGSLLQSNPERLTALLKPYRDKIASGEFAFVGAGVDPKQINLIESGYSSGQVGAKPFDIGYTATMTLYSAVKGQPVPPHVEVNLDVCTREKGCKSEISCPDHAIVCTDKTCRRSCN
jgi:ribose transport system substrate-binding protein